MLDVIDRKVPGAVVELGVYSGYTSRVFRRVLDKYDPTRQFHAYDSFEGLPERGAQDGPISSAISKSAQSKGGHSFPFEKFIRDFEGENLKPPDGTHKGFFEDIPVDEYPDPIAFAFFDGDLYSSIYDSFKMVYPKLAPGGVVVVHDFETSSASSKFSGSKRAVDDYLKLTNDTVKECWNNMARIVKGGERRYY
mmetsp:Transcript_23108/g.52118  ORF Transcript_23108/g.52118 Transcript_23108/m.52118 type:complete len:194 (-) Transcript_23108:391-972(-)